MKIVFLSDDFPPNALGGAGIIAHSLAYGVKGEGHEVFVITVVKDRKNEGLFKEEGINVYRIFSSYPLRFRAYLSLYNIAVIKKIEKILKDLKPDVIHAHNIHTDISYASLKIAKKYSNAVFLTLHDVMSVHYGKLGAKIDSWGNVIPDNISVFNQISQYRFYYNPFRNIVIRYYLKYVDRIFSVSEAIKKIIEKKGIKNIEVMSNGIDASSFQVDSKTLEDFKDKYNLLGKKVLFFGGRLSSSKGISVMIKVLHNILTKIENVVLLVAGEKNKLSENISQDKNVVFTGWISPEKMKYIYGLSDIVFVLSQYVDPFPTVNLEAMASKKPVIGTLMGGTPEIVSSGVTGYLVNPNDIDLISKKALELLKDKEKSESFGLAGYERVTHLFNKDVWVKKTISCYTAVLQNNKNHGK